MDVVYLFHESASIRVPFYDYDRCMFYLFLARSGGVWDNKNREFVLKQDVDAAKLSLLLPGIPLVQLQENSSAQPQVYGFFESPVNHKTFADVPDNNFNINSDTVFLGNQKSSIDNNNINTKKTFSKRTPIDFPSKPCNPAEKSPFSFSVPVNPPEKLSDYWRGRLEAELRSRKYSPQTRRAYIYYNRQICRHLQKTPEEIRPDDVTQFLALMEKDKDYSASALNLAISAIKFFFRNILKNEDIIEQHRPRHDERLPVVLSKEEISKILAMEKNPKHRLLLMLVYSSGLRVSEVVTLKRENIDISRKVIYVRLGKGRKDRCTLLSEKAALFIEEYCSFYSIEKWLFPGQPAAHHLTIRSAQSIFDKSVRRAGITKKITIHGLRHTFATHLLESGTDIRYIQSLLGHANLRTTERYTHVARRSVLKIQSPLDTIL